LAARPERASAWLSCDAADADPARFVAAIVEAARYGFGQPGIGEDARQLMSLDGEVSADVLAQQNVSDISDINKLVPSVQLNGTINGRVPMGIRGISSVSNEGTVGISSGVAIQVDGVPVPSDSYDGNDIMDVQSIEVLKGPQATLGGRTAASASTAAGAGHDAVHLHALHFMRLSRGRFADPKFNAGSRRIGKREAAAIGTPPHATTGRCAVCYLSLVASIDIHYEDIRRAILQGDERDLLAIGRNVRSIRRAVAILGRAIGCIVS